MAQLSDTEVLTTFQTNVDSVADAFAFVMAHLDKAGERPMIEILPCWCENGETGDENLYFEVKVTGLVKIPAEKKQDELQ